MSQLAQHPAYLLIEDHLDAIGQKYRGLRIVRGAILFVVAATIASLAAALFAHFAGAGRLARLTFVVWAIWIIASALWWILRPLLLRPRPVEIARLVETRIPDLHNGLTNSVLLAAATDLHDSPWLAPIFDEILALIRLRPLASAVSLKELRPLFIRLGILLAAALSILAFPDVRTSVAQGWRQMFNPTAFVPKVGRVRIINVSPRQITLVTGQPLEITLLADDPDKLSPAAILVFEKHRLPSAELSPTLTDQDQLRYTYRVEHVEESTRFRLEVAGSQSQWCQVNVVKQVKLQELSLVITPPPYVHKDVQRLSFKPEDIEKTALAVLEGSQVELSISADVPVKSALLQLDQDTPVPVSVSPDGRRFTQTFTVMRNVEAAVLLTEAGQVIAKLPDPALKIACTKDAAPQIDMKWPTQDTAAAPKAELKIQAIVKDDQGLATVRVLMAIGPDQPLTVVLEQPVPVAVPASPSPGSAAKNSPSPGTPGEGRGEGLASSPADVTRHSAVSFDLSHVLAVPAANRVHGQSIRVQVTATDNRDLASLVNAGPGAPTSEKDTGPQTTASPIYTITFRDPEQIAAQQKEQFDKLRQILTDLIKKQQALHTLAVAWAPAAKTMPQINAGQSDLLKIMQSVAESFPFDPDDKIVQKTLLVLAVGPANDAIQLSAAIPTEPIVAEKVKLNANLQAQQRRIIDTLESLLSRLNMPTAPTTQPGKSGGDLDNEKEKYKELSEEMKKFLAEEKRILDATATLAKKPVDNFDSADKKLLDDLKMSQEKLDAFMQEKISDFSKLAEQDMANASLLKELMEVYSEVTMAKDALKKQAVEMAIPAEEMGLELAKEIESNLEKWLMDEPDRQKWNQEDPLTKQDVPMAELPKELEDMVGELMEQQEDLFDEMEDTAANWADSLDKGAGWDAADGPIANMSAKGVTGNQLPNNNEMNGRSGEGRSGKSSGEFVEETATGKGGRNTPTRLDPTPFQQGQVKDESKDPVGGATGGGKISGQGGAGLEGPVPPKDLQEQMQRLAQKQAELRNKAERLDLDKKVGRYDNFNLMNSTALMRRVESDIQANRYSNALHRKDILLDKLDTSHLLLSGQIHLQKDTTPSPNSRMEDQIHDVLNGQLPATWSEPLKQFYKTLSE